MKYLIIIITALLINACNECDQAMINYKSLHHEKLNTLIGSNINESDKHLHEGTKGCKSMDGWTIHYIVRPDNELLSCGTLTIWHDPNGTVRNFEFNRSENPKGQRYY